MGRVNNGCFIDRFDSLNVFLSTIKSRPLNKAFTGREGCCTSEQEGRVSFTKTKTYEESEDIMSTGYHEGLKDMKKDEKAMHIQAKSSKSVPYASVVGYIPHVPNAIAGIPCSMISHKNVAMKSKMLSITYDITANSDVKADEFVKAGRVLLSFIEMLELKGYRIKLNMMLSSCKNAEASVALIKVKDFRQPVNPLKLSYMMLHPSFLRRQGLKWIETNPYLTDRAFTNDHGTPLYFKCDRDTREMDRWLRKNGALGENDVFVSFFDLINTDHKDLVKKLGIKA